MSKPCVHFSLDDAQRAADAWGFNCGPAALCAVLGLTPDELRPHMGNFEQKGYTNPTLMQEVLQRLGARHEVVWRSDAATELYVPRLRHGLMRVQWGGPWTRPGVPLRARYRHTHWVAVAEPWIFDVNAMCVGGWLPLDEWALQLVPWLLRQACPKGDGTWWPTHAWEVSPPGRLGSHRATVPALRGRGKERNETDD